MTTNMELKEFRCRDCVCKGKRWWDDHIGYTPLSSLAPGRLEDWKRYAPTERMERDICRRASPSTGRISSGNAGGWEGREIDLDTDWCYEGFEITKGFRK